MGKNRNNSKSRSYPGGGMYSKRQSGLFEARVKVFFPRSRVWKLAQYRREEREENNYAFKARSAVLYELAADLRVDLTANQRRDVVA